MPATCDSASEEKEEVRLGTLVMIRWFAIVGQAVTLMVVQAAFGLGGWLWAPLATVAASAGMNLWISLGNSAGRRVSGPIAAWHLGFDTLQLALLMFLTGGLSNPFALFFMAPVVVAAATLSLRRVGLLVLLAVNCVTVLAFFHLPLPWPHGEIVLPRIYLAGAWAALVEGIIFAAFYTWRMAEEARQRSAALAATRMALAQEQQMAAVGALAAAIAHELSTPLSTISLVAKEIAHDLPADSPLAEDVGLLVSQSERCRNVLGQLSRRGSTAQDEAIGRVTFDALVEMVAAPYQEKNPDKLMIFRHLPKTEDAIPPPRMGQRPEILHSLGNVIQNAVQFAHRQVEIETHWDLETVSMRIHDDGPGFQPHILAHMGEPYLSTRSDAGEHMGLGLFIAGTLLARTQGQATFANAETGGALVTIRWPRAALEAHDIRPA